MQPAIRSAIALGMFLVALLTSSCTYIDVEDIAAGRRHTIAGLLPADLQAVMRLCTQRLTFQAGQADLEGRRDLLRNCLKSNGDIDGDVLFAESPDNGTFIRWSAIAGVMAGQVNQTFAEPLPDLLQTRTIVRQDLALLIWVIPLLQAQLESQDIPGPVRDSILAVAIPILSQPTCRLTATVRVEFRRLGLEDFSLRWSTVDGIPSLRFRANLDNDRSIASYTIDPEYRCLGNTANLLHGVLRSLFASRDNRVFVSDGNILFNTLFTPNEGRIQGSPRLTLNIDEIEVAKPYGWLPDDVWRDMLRDFGVTPEQVEEDAQPQVEAALEGVSAQVGDLLTENLELSQGEQVRQISVDNADPRNLQVSTRYRGCFVLLGRVVCLPDRPQIPSPRVP